MESSSLLLPGRRTVGILLCEEGNMHLRLRSLLLLGENRVKHGFLDVRLELAACRVDEGISAAASELRILRLHVVLRRMISNLDITRQRADPFEGSIELISDGRR